MATPTTALVDVVTALVTVLRAYSVANPTKLRKVFTARPASVGETPFAYIGSRTEDITHTEGTRSRDFEIDVIAADDYGSDNEQVQGRLDILHDALVDVLTAGVRAVGYGVLEERHVGDSDLSLDVPGAIGSITWYRCRTFTVHILVTEGRV